MALASLSIPSENVMDTGCIVKYLNVIILKWQHNTTSGTISTHLDFHPLHGEEDKRGEQTDESSPYDHIVVEIGWDPCHCILIMALLGCCQLNQAAQ